MTQKYFAILTQYGAAQIADATAQKKTIHIEKMAVGDGAGKDTVPNDKQTKLIKENYRSALNSLKSEAGKNTVIAELIIKETIGGWWIREMGLYDDKGGLVAVANCPASYKPQLAEGSGKVQTLRMVFVVSNTAAVTISASLDIGIASIELVEETMKKHIKDDDPHSKDYYNKKITDKTNADLKKDLTATAVKEGSRGRDEATKYADGSKVALTGNQTIAGNKTLTGDTVVNKITAKVDVVSENSLIAMRDNPKYAPAVNLSNKALSKAVTDALPNGNSEQVGAYLTYAADTESGSFRKTGSLEFRVDKEGLTRSMWSVNHRDGTSGVVVLSKGSCSFPVPISAPDPTQTANDSFKVSSKWVNDKLAPYYQELPLLPSVSDLNDYINDGYTFQATNVNAAKGTNYPVPLAGLLEIKANGTSYIYQKYTTYDKSEQFTRTRSANLLWAAWVKEVNEQSGIATDSQKLGGKLANMYTLKSEADERYPIFADLGGKGLALEGCVNTNAKGQISNAVENDWTQGAFHNSNQPTALDNKTAWLASMQTQYSQGYSVISKIGTYRSGWQFGASMVFQMTGEANRPLGLWEMRQDGAFISKHLTLNKTAEPADFSKIVFEKKYPSAEKQILGAITWDSFRDVSAVSNVAAIWAEGAGTAANWGELHFGVTTNGDGNLPTKIMSISDGRVLTSQLHTYYLKSRDPAGSIADRARDYDGVSSLLRWQNYGNGHVIFDGSNGLSPSGGGVSVANATEPWREAFPVLMGWNGENTHGVRVDSCRTADKLLDGSFGVPTGVPVPWPSNTPPAGWIFLQGQGINPAEAPVLASLYGATLPDLRGMYISGWDAGRGIDPGRTVLSYQAANVGEHQHTVPFDDGGWLPYSGGGGQPGVNYVRPQPRATVDGPQGRTHPDNVAFNYIVRWG
ncbi:phage tail-collar fiber domain-containing protein [Janthinobacterium sp. B9-8]|uniref:phage tail-collar fiber domain-containing protein n=1 Tax=Janthinobacterium sp. B9-8 TaxID=1236179 RepID=UPI00076478E4|nr:phage tail protein [Janthinobacterium sp. B9-8]AMC35386.1 hypothetical protein VN23_12570 [Janthinobacterium sp. B9-8]